MHVEQENVQKFSGQYCPKLLKNWKQAEYSSVITQVNFSGKNFKDMQDLLRDPFFSSLVQISTSGPVSQLLILTRRYNVCLPTAQCPGELCWKLSPAEWTHL